MKFKNLLLGVIFFGMMFSSIYSQMFIKKVGVDKTEIHLVQEVGVLLVVQKDTIVVDELLPIDARMEENKELDIQKGDRILMINAKPVKTIKEFISIYKDLKVGDEVKWGIRRGKELLIITFKKGDPEKMKSGKKMIMRMDVDESKNPGDKKQLQFTMEKGSNINPDLVNLGLLFASEKEQLKVMHVMEHAIADVKNALADGDILLELNDAKLTAEKDFINAYEKISVGQPVKIQALRGDKAFELIFKKPESRVKIRIQKGNKDEK
ncbi:PDZ domain-containing protein [candidate division KSB1 bacterium]|nr:PDZ domain-containing protein [candidate division KSB1 bacterium]